VVHVVGARPNYMKIAPVYVELSGNDRIRQALIHTGQHYDRLLKDVFFDELTLPRPHLELAIGSGTHAAQTAAALAGLGRAFEELRPDAVVVPGDVNSTLAGALAAVQLGIPVVHLEAGLRSNDWSMPEEHNRKLTDHVSALLLTHSEPADANLLSEGIPPDRIERVGNTMVDTLLATLHRPALVDSPDLLSRTATALSELAAAIPVVFPVHPRTRARLAALNRPLGNIRLLDPLPYLDFVSLELGAAAVLTDSGGVQEETTALGVPCFTLRANTERPVTVTHGTNTVLGLDPERVLDLPALLSGIRPHGLRPELWDGHAGERAAAAISRLVL
jgi:UDP-N-acetylglucosamine 2-epimerase (non-hydrolysing)